MVRFRVVDLIGMLDPEAFLREIKGKGSTICNRTNVVKMR